MRARARFMLALTIAPHQAVPDRHGECVMSSESDGVATAPDTRSTLRIIVLALAGAQVLHWLFFWYYIGQHSNPMGDGMEWIAIVPATLLFLAFAVPALILGLIGRLLWVAAALAGIGVVLNLIFFLQIAAEFAGKG
jgi:hypothetical protein